ncbi:unnamed protein product [Camellia sinensis]
MGVEIVESNTCIRGCCRSDLIPLHLPPSSYSLLNPIARGAESVVYEAVLDGNKVAMKKPILSTSDHIDKFHKELQMRCKLDHLGIATLVAAHAKPPNYMFFFKFYESLNLAEKLHVEEWNPTFDQVLTISVQLGKMARPSKKISNKKSEQKFQKSSKKSFKPTSKTDETQVLAMQLQDDVPDFPRATARGGGRSSLGKEVDEVDGDDVDMEFESGERELNNNNYKNKNKRLQKRNHSAEEDDLGSLFGDGISGKLPRFANKITLKNISPGMKLWGVIAEVNEKDIVISLPGGLRGLVRASEAFDPISDNKVKVITAYVKSIEDHGYILHFGLPSFTGFMSKNSQAGRSFQSSSLSGITQRTPKMRRGRSELGLDPGDDPTSLCHVEQVVKCRVTSSVPASRRINLSFVITPASDRQRISLGMKNSYFMSNYDIQAPSKQKYDDAIEEKDHMVGTQLTMLPDRGTLGMQNLDFECENGQHLLLAEVEARASILPLEVPLDDIEKSDMVNAACQNIEHVDDADADAVDQKNKSQAKKKANEEREREIRAAEERLLEKDIPRSADEFEKVVRISPNSSFVWIKYMAFMLSLADVEKAHSIAERALKTINIREESEKLNDAVSKIFGRALQYCDPKKVHLALLGMYERIEQHKLADELLSKMSKKFKHSCKVWLRRIQWLLNQNRDEVQSIVKRAVVCLPH